MIVWFYQLILGFNWCRNGIPRIIVRFNAGKTRKSTIYKAPSANVSGKCIVWEEIMEELSSQMHFHRLFRPQKNTFKYRY